MIRRPGASRADRTDDRPAATPSVRRPEPPTASGLTGRERRTLGSLVLALAVVAGVVAIPGAPPESGPGVAAVPTPGWTTSVVRYREGVVGGWSSVTPISVRTAADRQLVGLVFSGLVGLGPGQELVPALATSWTSGDDGKRWEFTLDPAARWHDGVPVTASDVVFTFEVLRDPAYVSLFGASWQEVKVSAPDPRSVVFELKTPLGGFPQSLTQGILPKHLLAGLSVDEIQSGPFATAPVGTGPFRLATIDETSAELVRVAADGSAGSAVGSDAAGTVDASGGGLPIEEFALRFYPDPAALLAAFRAGDVDGAVGLGPTEVSSATGLDARIDRYPTSTLTAVIPNERGKSNFKILALRKALDLSIDRDAIVADVMGPDAIRADGLIPPTSWAYSEAATPRIPFDLSAATKSLRSAGWKEGSGGTGWVAKGRKQALTLSLIAPNAATNPLTYAAAERVADAWRRLGFEVELTGLERDELANRLQAGQFMLAVVSMNIGLDPDLYPFLASSQVRVDGSNVAGVQIAALDELLLDARRAGTLEERRARYEALQAYLSKNSTLFPLYFANQSVVVSPRLVGPAPREIASLGDRYWDVLTWRLADGR